MLITREWLIEKDAYQEARELFDEQYPNGVDHNELLKAISEWEDNRAVEFGQWLVDAIGPTNEIAEYPDGYKGRSLFFCGTIKAKCSG